MNERSILVVDDDRSIRETFIRQLGAAGYTVAAAESAERGIGAIGADEPAVVITDLRMPGMNGLEFLGWVRSNAPDVDVIILTAHEDMNTAIAAIKAGAYEFLVKPLDLDQFELVLSRCFRDCTTRRRMQHLTAEAAAPYAVNRMVGRDPKMIAISKTIGSLAASRTPVLIRGETGTGKEVIARTIHYSGPTADEPFIAINCTAIPESLLESELFGHLRGAFTGATSDRKGRFELAGMGTVFLDEIGDVTPSFQAKLLRVLQDGEFYPVGSERSRKTSARVIAATHRPLEQLVQRGEFREDLYYRLRVVEIVIPPLRERRGDIRLFAEALAEKIGRDVHKQVVITPPVMRALEEYLWPGNVRELENALTRAIVLARSSVLALEDLSLGGFAVGSSGDRTGPVEDYSLESAILAHVHAVLDRVGGNKRKVARLLGISRARLDRWLERRPAANRDRDGAETMPADDEAEASDLI